MLSSLNEKQLIATKLIDGPVMVMAGAGSGKTKVLTHRIAYLIKEIGISPENILAITFTNKATIEMKERIKNLINIETDKMWISTFHAFCAKILREELNKIHSRYSSNFEIIDVEDSVKIIKGICDLFSEKENVIFEISAREIQKFFSERKNKNSPLPDELEIVFKEYNNYLCINNLMDFDDLLIQGTKLLRENPEILEKYQKKFQYILVDEFQDTNILQYFLIKMLSQINKNIFVVGDDFQSIYSFRGAELENIDRFRKDFKDTKLILLEQNYRSTQEILDLGNAVIANNKRQIKKTLFTENPSGQIPYFFEAYNEWEEAQNVVDLIKNFKAKNIKYKENAILYRFNSNSRIFEDTMIKNNIPYIIYGGLPFYSRKEVKDMLAYMKLIINPDDDISFRRIVNEPKRKIGAVTLEKLSEKARELNVSLLNAIPYITYKNKSDFALLDFYNFIELYKNSLENNLISDVFNDVYNNSGYHEKLIIDCATEKIDNLFELFNVFKELEENADEDKDNKTILLDFFRDLALRTDKENKNETDCVVLSTVHQVKGLEFENVFMVATEENRREQETFSFDRIALEEERRIFYVAITRAKKRLYISFATRRNHQFTNLRRFILEVDKNLFKSLNTTYEELVNRFPYVKDTTPEKFYPKLSKEIIAGTKIKHKVFGVGIVKELIDDDKILVNFILSNEEKILLKYHNSVEIME